MLLPLNHVSKRCGRNGKQCRPSSDCCSGAVWAASSKFGTCHLCEHIRAVLPEPPLLAHTSSESRGTFRQKARSLALLNGWACTVKICHEECSETQIRLTRPSLIWVGTACPGLSVQKLRMIIVVKADFVFSKECHAHGHRYSKLFLSD